MKKLKRRTVILKPSGYRPSEAELEKEIKLDIPGKDIHGCSPD